MVEIGYGQSTTFWITERSIEILIRHAVVEKNHEMVSSCHLLGDRPFSDGSQ
ncbi:hypothetical protein HNR46_002218 [Haloferula luteola]|uniref:Uncharacterized protein n=1 Tax=Haloferula luteola TaxID=595692 RepID=A0A840V0U2_9BACT|nr:hypothetical protein [Haloferula luteola]